jgi:opacity protein-like surface antigen
MLKKLSVVTLFTFLSNVTGNLSYRHYSYNERDFAIQDYRANILTTSLRFTF